MVLNKKSRKLVLHCQVLITCIQEASFFLYDVCSKHHCDGAGMMSSCVTMMCR
jgi:hypothetical protein